MSVRSRRLLADHDQIREGLRDHPAIKIHGVSGNPPERYQIAYKVRGLAEGADGTIRERLEHVTEVFLTLAYPRQAPQCRMLTPVFHPNIAPHAVCIGDHWAAGESLLQLIIRVGEMLAYQSYNVKSPLNGAAARWVDEHPDQVPTDPRDLSCEAWAGRATAPGEGHCQNCSAPGDPLHECANGHLVCEGCLVKCGRCERATCLLCKLESCSLCARLICPQCRSSCPQCQRSVCTEHLRACSKCGQPGCDDCSIPCAACGRTVCLAHVSQCAVCQSPLCADHHGVCTGCGKSFCATHFDAQQRICGECQPGPEAPPPSSGVYQCQQCPTRMRISPELLGKPLKCPGCGSVFTVN